MVYIDTVINDTPLPIYSHVCVIHNGFNMSFSLEVPGAVLLIDAAGVYTPHPLGQVPGGSLPLGDLGVEQSMGEG